jgi:hypothetical protein
MFRTLMVDVLSEAANKALFPHCKGGAPSRGMEAARTRETGRPFEERRARALSVVLAALKDGRGGIAGQ